MTGNYFAGTNCLVTGGTGFIGTNLILKLLERGAKVRATLHRKPTVIRDPRISYENCDLLRMEDCKKIVQGIDHVFMCAANTSGAAVMAHTPLVHVTPNIIMNSQMLEASYFAQVKKFVFISSSAAYPPTGDRPVKEEELLEGDPYETYFPVGWMKRYSEVLCRMYTEKLKNPLCTIVIRPSNIYGPYDDFEPATSHMMASLLRRVVERQNPFVVWGNGKDIKDLIHIDDFLEGLFAATEKITSFDPVNIASGQGYNIKEVLSCLLESDGFQEAQVSFDASKPSVIPVRLIDTAKAKTLLGFQARTSLKEGIEKTLRWYREYYR